MDALIGLAGFIGIIVSVIVLIIKAIKKKPKKKPLIALAICFTLFVIALLLPSSRNSSSTSAPTETPAPTDFEVSINATAHKEGTAIVFEIDTNMPDDTQLMLTLSKGNYNTDERFTAQTKVVIINGKATSSPFSDKGNSLVGDYDLSISMSLPSLQSDSVRTVIGQNGEYMTGTIVKPAIDGSTNVINAMFSVSIGDDVIITTSNDYHHTIFADETGELETFEYNSIEQEARTQANKAFISKYETDIVVSAKMALDRFISDYKISLAPQKWTMAKFDETETTVIALTDITYNSQEGKYIYVGTLDIDGEKVVSAKPHYLEVNGIVLGDDGYCNDVFDKIKELG